MISRFFRHLREPFASSVHPPWFDARGIGIGLFIGLGIPVGAQMVLLGLLRILFKFNTVMAFTFTWVNNPITLIPMYYGFYCLGSLILGESVMMNVEDFQHLMRPVLHAGHFWDAIHAFMYLGLDLLVRWFVGALLVGAAVGVLGYVAGYRIRKNRCKRKARQLGIAYDRLVKTLEANTKVPRRGAAD
ncbi:MAG TPA: DUF2062 domain-containing protein [Desulfomonilaceae bacterium]|nr:DUF2062 domain-containing protein [Desulfomonilaceae bacterium]